MAVNMGVVITVSCSASAQKFSACPMEQITPPTQNARIYPWSLGLPGVFSFTS